MDTLHRLHTNLPITQIEELVRNQDFYRLIIEHITLNITNYHSDFGGSIGETDLMGIKNMSIDVLISVYKNLVLVINRYLEIKPGSYIPIDRTNKWYSDEKIIVEMGDPAQSVTSLSSNTKMSKLFTICCKIIDFINEHYDSSIRLFEDRIKSIKMFLREKRDSMSVNSFNALKQQSEIVIGEFTAEIKKFEEQYFEFHQNTISIRSYVLTMFEHEYYLQNTPQNIFNIFNSSLYFIDRDSQFLQFVTQLKPWIPSEIRCNYLEKIIFLRDQEDLDREILDILHRFRPNPYTLIEDIVTYFYKSDKNPAVFSNILLLQFYIYETRKDISSWNFNFDKILIFLSVQIDTISKLTPEHFPNRRIYENILHKILHLINYFLLLDNNLVNTWLVYQIPNTLSKFYKPEVISQFENPDMIFTELNSIFHVLINSRFGVYYLSSMIEDDIKTRMIELMNPEQIARFEKYYSVYKKISDVSDDPEIIDPLTSTVIVIPFVIPMNEDGSVTSPCDKYVLESYLWSKKQNPFNRKELTIQMFEEFNQTQESVQKIAEVKAKLKGLVDTLSRI